MEPLDVSVVIGFKDWGADRLRRPIESIYASAADLGIEAIVSDYGSSDPSVSKSVADAAGARWISTPNDPQWSRSRALNAGFQISLGDVFVSTDADMVFAPKTLQAVHATVHDAAPCAVFLQCRDLPEDTTARFLASSSDISWAGLEQASRFRPRWGMGGLMAIDREGFQHLHGFDERMHTYGREDLDFALRARRAGRRIVWADDEESQMFHLWHPPSGVVASSTTSGREAMARNRAIVDHDLTTSRNLTSRAVSPDVGPLVSVIVKPGPPEVCQRTMATALAQSVRDLEVIVCSGPVPNGPRHRVRYTMAREEGAGPVAAALEMARGTYIMVVEAGDLLHLGGVERLLMSVVDGAVGATGTSTLSGSSASPSSVCSEEPVLIHRDVLRAVLPLLDDQQSSALDDLGNSGYRLGRSDEVVAFRPRERSVGSLPGPDGDAEAQCLLRQLDDADDSSQDPVLIATLPAGARAAEWAGEMGPATAEVFELHRGDEMVHGSLLVRHPTFSLLAAIADVSTTVRFVEACSAGHPPHTWVDEIVEDARRRGHAAQFEIHRGINDVLSNDSYRFRSSEGDIELHVASPSDASHADCQRWILVGEMAPEEAG